jgi:hypothetical protein
LGTTDEMCDNLFGQDEWVRDDENKKVIESLQSQIDGLVAANDILAEYLTNTQTTLTVLQNLIAGSVTMEQYDSLLVQINSLNATVNNMQEQINVNVVRLAELELEDPIVEYYDPCGNGPGFDEIIMTTRSGKLVAYFESGSNRFLTVLTPGNYSTTDTQKCKFTVNSSGQITNEH